jgi:hypothetical protein
MGRIRDYVRFIAWQTGLSYLLMWAVTFWALDYGAAVFGTSGVCHPDAAKELFYWVCDASSPLSILSTVVNVALTATVWAPVYIAAASVQPEAMTVAAPIIAIHAVGFPLALFVLVRTVAAVLDFGRRNARGGRQEIADAPSTDSARPPQAKSPKPAPSQPRKVVPPRGEFGLRTHPDVRQAAGRRRAERPSAS